MEFELEGQMIKKHKLEEKEDTTCQLTAQVQEIQSTNKSRVLRIAEILHLHQRVHETQQILRRLIPGKQIINDQLKQVQQNSLQRFTSYTQLSPRSNRTNSAADTSPTVKLRNKLDQNYRRLILSKIS